VCQSSKTKHTFSCCTGRRNSQELTEPMLQVNVCSLGWVINSNTVRSVVCVSLSFPESANHWDRWKESPTGAGSSHWRDRGPAVPVLTAGLAQRHTAGPLVGLSRPSGQDHIPL
jgi:hypothetical protein